MTAAARISMILPTSPWPRSAIAIGLGISVLSSLLAGCSPAPEPKLTLNGVEYTQAEFRYGLNVHPTPKVKLAEDVVLVENGAQAIRSVTGDGVTWTLDPKAPGIDKVQVGKVMFLTGRAVGRVVEATTTDAGVEVSVAPVDITEVISDGSFDGADLALDPSQLIAYDTGPLPWSVVPLGPSGGASEPSPGAPSGGAPGEPSPGSPSGSVVRLARYAPPDGVPEVAPPAEEQPSRTPVEQRPPPPEPAWGGARPSSVGDYHIVPICCDTGMGVLVNYDKNGLTLSGKLEVTGSRPSIDWSLDISAAHIDRASLTVAGVAGIAYSFDAETKSGIPGNVHNYIAVPVQLAWTFVVEGIPFTLSISQSLIFRSAFSAKTGKLAASGAWSFSGGLGFNYTKAGGMKPSMPSGVATQSSMLNSMEGVSVGASGLVLAHRVEARVGIGTAGFMVGPFVDIASSIGASRGSSIGIVVCQGVDLNLDVGAGLSYRLPNIVVSIVNFVLRVFKAKPIAPEGPIKRVQVPVFHASAVQPDSKICH